MYLSWMKKSLSSLSTDAVVKTDMSSAETDSTVRKLAEEEIINENDFWLV